MIASGIDEEPSMKKYINTLVQISRVLLHVMPPKILGYERFTRNTVIKTGAREPHISKSWASFSLVLVFLTIIILGNYDMSFKFYNYIPTIKTDYKNWGFSW